MGWQDSPIISQPTAPPPQGGGWASSRVVSSPQPPARIGPVEEPTFAERYVAPALESIGGAIKAATPYMDPRVSKAVEFASNPAPLVQGMADAPVGLTQLLFEALGQGDRVTPAIQAQEARYQRSRGSEEGEVDPARLAASILNPLPIKGAGLVKPAQKAIGKVAQGAAIGGATAATQPVYDDDFASAKGEQVGVGTLFGAAIPTVAQSAKQVARGAYHVVEPWLPGGAERVAGRTAVKVAGDKSDDVVRALESEQTFVKGSRPTSGEAAVPAGSAEFAGLQREVEPRLPSEYRFRDIEQDQARRSAIREVGKDKAALEAAKTARGVAANRNYAAAYEKEIKADPELAKLAADPFFKRALPMAEDLAKSGKVDPKKNLTQFLHFVKLSIDDRLGKTGEGALGNTERKAVEGVKQRLVAWMEKKSPEYGKAREEFAEASKPIDQMKVGQALEKKLDSALTTEGGASKGQRAELFSSAVREAPQTIKRATTGGPRYQELEDVLTPEQTEKVRGVVKDLARSADYEDMGRRGAAAARKAIGANLDPKQLPNLLERTVTTINAILKRVQGTAEGKSLDALAKLMQEPKEMARVMKAATQQEREGLLTSLFGAAETGGASAATGAATGKATSGEVEDAPKDVKKRELGRVYRTPKGPMEWSENGWLTLKK